jgi:hypothetical protein
MTLTRTCQETTRKCQEFTRKTQGTHKEDARIEQGMDKEVPGIWAGTYQEWTRNDKNLARNGSHQCQE